MVKKKSQQDNEPLTWFSLFAAGATLGFQPREVLDMTFWQFNACLTGYQNRMLDLSSIAVEQGYWAAYYSNAKHPKNVAHIVAEKQNAKKILPFNKPKKVAEPNIASFEALEKIFKEEGAYADGIRKV